MTKALNSLKQRMLESPAWKTFFATVIPVAAGVLSGTFVSEITINSQLIWTSLYKSPSFYGLIVLTVILFFYNRATYLQEKDIEKFIDDDYCRAYMRSKCLPEAAEKYKQMIRNGNGSELKNAMKEFERILK